MNIRNTFLKPSTRFHTPPNTLSLHADGACFKNQRGKATERRSARLRYVCKCTSVLVCRRPGSHLGDEKLTQANFTAFIFILLVTRPSASHPAPHGEGEKKNEKWATPQSLQQALSPSLPPSTLFLSPQHSEGQR